MMWFSLIRAPETKNFEGWVKAPCEQCRVNSFTNASTNSIGNGK